MPIVIRSLGLGLFTAKYRFSTEESDSKVWPWLKTKSRCDDYLCSICSRLNFPWLFEFSLHDYKVTDGTSTCGLTDGICLGLYSDIANRTTCPLCQFLIHTLTYWADYDIVTDSDDWCDREVYLMNFAFNGLKVAPSSESIREKRSIRLAVSLRQPDDEKTLARFGDRQAMIQRLDPGTASPFGGLCLAQDCHDIVKRIKEWIEPCISRPILFNSRSLRGPENFLSLLLIDTERMCVVGPLANQQYVALSYTWGKIDPLILKLDNETLLRQDGSLNRYLDKLPKTIKNAVSLCSMLGQKYLWVDSLCIVQDGKDKQEQIQQMDRIYQEATLTIVAAAGKDGNAGLPGVSAARHLTQRIINIDSLQLTNVLPTCGTSLGASEWNWRGWTFQEGLLSTRKLVFTVDQVYFHCPHGECSEDTRTDIHETFSPSLDSDFRLKLSNISNWTVYENIVATYCRRELSFESDALNAFAGIASYLSKTVFSGSPFVSGIPLCSLELGLLWQPSGRLRRRLDPKTGDALFPSWSWVAWFGNLEYGDTSGLRNGFERSISRVKLINVPEHLVTGKPSPGWDEWNHWRRKVVEGSDDDVYDIYYTRNGLSEDQWFAHPIDASVTKSAWPQTNLTWSHLDIEAEVAQLKLTGEHANLWYRSEECDEGDHEICRLQVFDREDRKAGTVVMDGATYDSIFNNTAHSATENDLATSAHSTAKNDFFFSFVKIAQTTLAFGRDDPAWDDESKSFAGQPGAPALKPWPRLAEDEEQFDQDVYDRNICWCLYDVLVVRFEGETAQRVAVGRVHIHAFDGAEPTRSRIRLG